MIDNLQWLINETQSYFDTLPIAEKGFGESIIIDHKYKNQFPRDTLPTPKIMISEIRNDVRDLTFDGERSSNIGIQANIYAGIMNINGADVQGYQAVNHIAILLDKFYSKELGFRRIGATEPLPSEENPQLEYVRPLRYRYVLDVITNTIL